jgi:hypothetical protein
MTWRWRHCMVAVTHVVTVTDVAAVTYVVTVTHVVVGAMARTPPGRAGHMFTVSVHGHDMKSPRPGPIQPWRHAARRSARG